MANEAAWHGGPLHGAPCPGQARAPGLRRVDRRVQSRCCKCGHARLHACHSLSAPLSVGPGPAYREAKADDERRRKQHPHQQQQDEKVPPGAALGPYEAHGPQPEALASGQGPIVLVVVACRSAARLLAMPSTLSGRQAAGASGQLAAWLPTLPCCQVHKSSCCVYLARFLGS